MIRNALTKAFEIILVIYFVISAFIATPYYQWRFAHENGFVTWLLGGQKDPFLQSLIWPYHLSKYLFCDPIRDEDWYIFSENIGFLICESIENEISPNESKTTSEILTNTLKWYSRLDIQDKEAIKKETHNFSNCALIAFEISGKALINKQYNFKFEDNPAIAECFKTIANNKGFLNAWNKYLSYKIEKLKMLRAFLEDTNIRLEANEKLSHNNFMLGFVRALKQNDMAVLNDIFKLKMLNVHNFAEQVQAILFE